MYKFTLLEKGKAWTQAQQRLILQHLQRQVMGQTPPLTPHSPLSHSHFCVLTEYREMSLCIHNGPQVLFQLQGSQAHVFWFWLHLCSYTTNGPQLFSHCALCTASLSKPNHSLLGSKVMAASLVWGFAILLKYLGSHPGTASTPSCPR